MTSAPVTDLRPHVDAVRTTVTASLGQWSAYEYGRVPGENGNEGLLPYIFALVSVERRYAPPSRLPGQSGRSGWRASVRTVGRSADEARWAMAKATDALDEKRLTISGARSSLLQFESATDAEPDDGRYSALAQWTYVL